MARRVTKSDFEAIARHIFEEAKRRRALRKSCGIERAWAEIDRQVMMIPDKSYKMNADGSPNADFAWMPEVELPLQAQTLEVLTADARRLMCPDGGDWFSASGLMTDEILDRLESKSLMAGEENDVPSKITQDNLDKLIVGVVREHERQYDFWGHVDRINAEAFRYGLSVARVREIKKSRIKDAQGSIIRKDAKIAVLVPRSIKHVYPDDRCFVAMQEGEMVTGLVIESHRKSLADLRLAAEKGSKDVNDPQGGWVPAGLRGIDAEKDGMIHTLEAEGDFIIERKSGPALVFTNVCVEVACGKEEQAAVFRIRYIDEPTYVFFPYHYEDVQSVYPTCPLMKGWPIQAAASEALCRLMIGAAMNAMPPVAWDRSDSVLAAQGGPKIHPGATIGSLGNVTALVVSNPSALAQVYSQFLMQYSDVTGVNAPRLGAQTISHTTAYAKQTEVMRGEARTVDYVNTVLKAGLTLYLEKAYRIARRNLRDSRLYIESYGAWVDNLSAADLPEDVAFRAIGAGGPAEENQKRANKLAAVQLAIQIHQLAQQQGMDDGLDLKAVQYSVLRDGGWTDVEALVRPDEGDAGGPPPGPEMAGAAPALGATEAQPGALAALGVTG